MPLFAAYSQPEKNDVRQEPDTKVSDSTWLQNSSFQLAVAESLSETSVKAEIGVKTKEKDEFEAIKQIEESTDSSDDDKEKRKHKKSKRKHAKRKSKSGEKKKKKERSRSRDRSEKKKKSIQENAVKKEEDAPLIAKGIVFSNGLNLRPSQAFYIDQKGDRNNKAFPNLYYKNVPRYYPVHITLGGKNITKLKLKRQKPLRYFGKKAIKRISKMPTLVPVKNDAHQEHNPLGIYDAGTVLYIQGRSSVNLQESNSVSVEEDKMKRVNVEFNQRLKQEPQNIKLWLDFIDFQDTPEAQRMITADSLSSSKEKQGKNLHRRALLERKVSILDKAIDMNPKSVELITAKLQIASEFWEAGVLQQEWKKMLFVHPMSIDLWKKYLSFTENYFEGFSVNNVLKAYSSCIQKMVQMQHPSFSSHQRPDHLEEHMIDIISRLCLFLRHSGLTEKSISVYQALIELGLNRLHIFNKPKEELRSMLPVLQSFWDSGAPRFGEDKIVDSAMDSSQQFRLIQRTDLSDMEDAIIHSGQSHSTVWSRVERLRSLEHWQSWTNIPGSEEECDDVERSIGFSDISLYLFALEKIPCIQFRLVAGFLQSLGVPLYPAVQAQVFWAPAVSEESIFYLVSTVPDLMYLPSVAPTLLNSNSYFNWLRRIVVDSFATLPEPYKLELALWWLNVERIRISSVMSRPAGSSDGPQPQTVWKETKRWIKNFLKGISMEDLVSTLLLYNAYAAVELDAGNKEESGRILQMMLSMYSWNPLQETNRLKLKSSLRTWLSYANHLIRSNDHEAALAHLLALGAGLPFNTKPASPTPAMLLKAKRKYQSLYQQIVDDPSFFNDGQEVEVGLFNQPDFVVDFLGCYSLFSSLTEGCRPAFALVDQWLKRHHKTDSSFVPGRRFDPQSIRYHTRRELVYTNLLQLLSACRPWVIDVQPRLHHETLRASLSEYPKSFQLLSIFIESEEQCNTFNRLWNSLTSAAKSKEDDSTTTAVVSCLALARRGEVIHQAEERAWKTTEASDPVIHQGYRNKIEHLVDYCVSQHPGRHTPLLWRILIRSAHLKGDSQRCKALFYRAIRDCPWSKDIMMDVVDYVPSLIKEVTGLLMEKDLRLRFPLEELDLLLEPEPDMEEGGVHGMDQGEELENQMSNQTDGQSPSDSEDNLSQDYEDGGDSDV